MGWKIEDGPVALGQIVASGAQRSGLNFMAERSHGCCWTLARYDRFILHVYGTGVEDQWEERETGNGETS